MKIPKIMLTTSVPGFHKWRNHSHSHVFFMPHHGRLQSKATQKKLLAIDTQKSFDLPISHKTLKSTDKRHMGYGN